MKNLNHLYRLTHLTMCWTLALTKKIVFIQILAQLIHKVCVLEESFVYDKSAQAISVTLN